MSRLSGIVTAAAASLAIFLAPSLAAGQTPGEIEIIDVHLHGGFPEQDLEAARIEEIEKMEAAGVALAVVGVTTREEVEAWQGDAFIVAVLLACPRNLAAPYYHCFPDNDGWADIGWLEQNVASGRIGAIHEVLLNYSGLSPANPRFESYWTLAERYDIPVGFHTQRGPAPGGAIRSNPNCCPTYDPEMGNPALLRPVLERHPDIRIWIQHVGAGQGTYGPFWDETLALLRDYPNVYVDLSITNSLMPFEQYEASLRRLFDAGFGDRIMYGSDNAPVNMTTERLGRIAWLSEADRRAILSGNAKRFFRLSEAEASE